MPQIERRATFNLNTLGPRLEELHERLAGAVIENLDFEVFLKRYDRPGMLFYLDPPYWSTEWYYGKDLFNPSDFERLVICLRELKGRWIVSINDHPRVRQLFDGCQIEEVRTTYAVRGRGHADEVGELIIASG